MFPLTNLVPVMHLTLYMSVCVCERTHFCVYVYGEKDSGRHMNGYIQLYLHFFLLEQNHLKN